MTLRDFTDTLSKLDVGTLATWQAAGLTKRQLYTLVESGQLVKIRHGAYATSSVLARAASDPGLRHAVDVTAIMATRMHRGIASHHSAALLHGLRLLKQPPRDSHADGPARGPGPGGTPRASSAMPPNCRTSR